MIGRRQVAQEQEDHQDDQHDGEHQRELHVVHRLADGDGAVVPDVERHRGRQLLAEARQQLLHRVDDRDDVGAGLFLDGEVDRPLALDTRRPILSFSMPS